MVNSDSGVCDEVGRPSRRAFLQTATAAAVGAVMGGGMARADGRKPNVLLILIDDLGWRDLGCYGRPDVFETPHIDKLAAEGMRFTQAYSNCPVCSPSRAAIMTGQTPARLRYTGHITSTGKHRHPENSRIIPPDDDMNMPMAATTIPEALKRAGYTSAHFGKWHLGYEGHWPLEHGFDLNIGGGSHGSPANYFDPYKNPENDWNPVVRNLTPRKEGEYLPDRLTDEAIAFMAGQGEKPWFLNLAYYAVHTPLQAPAALVAKYEAKFAGKDTGVNPIYAAMVEAVDTNVGRLMAALEAQGIAGDTLVVFASDNGGTNEATTNAPLRESKSWVYEGGIRVPFILRWPGRIAAGTTCTEPVYGADIYPTILAAAGAPLPSEPIDGVDLAPLWNGGTLGERTLTWYYPHYSASKQPGSALRRGDEKYVVFYDPPREELYDLAADPGETRNLAGERPERLAALRDALQGYLTGVNARPHRPNPAFREAAP